MLTDARPGNIVEPVTNETVGDEIRRRREALGMTVRDLARRVPYDRGRLSDLEQGRATARPSTIGAIRKALDKLEGEVSGPYDESQDFIEFNLSGEGDFHVVVKGPVKDAELLREQVAALIRQIRRERE